TRGALLLAGEFAVASHVEQPGLTRLDGVVHFFFGRDDTLARMRSEVGRGDLHFALLERTALGRPLLDTAFHQREPVVAVAPERKPQPRRVVPALRVIADDHRVVADAEAAHCRGERIRALQHPTWMTRRGWGSREIARPIAVDRAREV